MVTGDVLGDRLRPSGLGASTAVRPADRARRAAARGLTLAAVLVLGSGCGTPKRLPTLSELSRPEQVRLVVPQRYLTYTMRNGLVVVLAPQDNSNLVTVDVRYFAGGLDEPAEKTGVAHLLEHVLFGVAAESGRELSDELGEVALSYNGATSYDATEYSSVALATGLDALLRLEARRMQTGCAQLSDALLERERAVVQRELAQREAEQGPGTALARAVWGASHRFAHGVGGSALASLRKEDACAFLDEHYSPSNAALVIGGAITQKQALALVARHFDPIPGRPRPTPAALPPLPLSAAAGELSLAGTRSGILLAFPLEAAGTRRRMEQDLAIHLASSALADAAADVDDLSISVQPLGSDRAPAIAVALLGTRARTDQELTALMRRALDGAWRDVPERRLLAIKLALATQILSGHDDLLERSELITAACQQSDDTDYQSGQISRLMSTDMATVRSAGEALFAPARSRLVRIRAARAQDGGVQPDLADLQEGALPHLIAAPRTSPPLSLALPELRPPTELRLKNGLRVILVPRPGADVFEARMVFSGGDADDPPGKAGTAALTAALLNQRTEVEIIDLLAMNATLGLGTELFAATSAHHTTHGVRGVSALASSHLLFLHSILARGEIHGEALAKLRKLAKASEDKDHSTATDRPTTEARRERQERDLLLATKRRLFGEGHPLLKSHRRELASIEVGDLERFRKKHYRVGDAVLVVAGGFDPAQVEREVYEMWGGWQSGAAPASAPAATPMKPERGPSYLALERTDRQLALELFFAASSDPLRDAGARAVLEELLRSRLRGVRTQLAASYGFDARYVTLEAGSLLSLRGQLAPNRAAEVTRAIAAALDLASTEPGELALQVDRARRAALEHALASATSSSATAERLAEAAARGLPLTLQGDLAAAIAAVETDHVRALAATDLAREHLVMTATGPGAAAALRAAGATQVTAVR